jgi:RHH-type transcriptional regulator, rel operon repressor / antitoxin RelB
MSIMSTPAPQLRTINVPVAVSVLNEPDELATATARTKSFVPVKTFSSYLQTQAWQVKEVQDAIAEADSGDFASDEQINAVFAKYCA